MKIWLNGDMFDGDAAHVNVRDRGVLLGDGLFETLLAERRRIYFVDAHLKRLHTGSKTLGIPIPFDDGALIKAFSAVLSANALTDEARVSLRLTLTRGPGPRGSLPPREVHPTVFITAAATSPPPTTMTAVTATITRRNEHSPVSRIKSLNYLDNVLARQEAANRGCDEAILLNTAGRVAETTAANIFLWKDNRLTTPAIGEGALPGITRALILESAQREGIDTAEGTVKAEHLREADEVFLTNSLIGAVPLVRIDETDYEDGPVCQTLAQAYASRLLKA